MIVLVLAVFLLVLTFFLYSREGMKEPFLSSVIESIESALKDERMSPSQKIALQDALSYANYIKNI
jgi:hypothetical protein